MNNWYSSVKGWDMTLWREILNELNYVSFNRFEKYFYPIMMKNPLLLEEFKYILADQLALTKTVNQLTSPEQFLNSVSNSVSIDGISVSSGSSNFDPSKIKRGRDLDYNDLLSRSMKLFLRKYRLDSTQIGRSIFNSWMGSCGMDCIKQNVGKDCRCQECCEVC